MKKDVKKTVKTRNDIILLAVLITAITIGLLFLFINQKEGKKVVVFTGKDKYAEYSLEENITVKIQSKVDSEDFNLLVISNGEARIIEASCPDLICANHTPIKFEGESIICIPNNLVVAIE